MRVLFVNHTGIRGGGEESLLDLLAALPGDIRPVLACPAGELAEACRERAIPVELIPAVEASLRLHPTRTARGLAQIVRSANGVRRIMRSQAPDIVHANSIRAGLIATLATAAGGPPVVVHVRDCLPDSKPANATRRVIARGAARVVAISGYTAANFSRSRAGGVEVIYDPMDLKRFDSRTVDRAEARERLHLEPGMTALAVVGQITPWKGQATAIQALAALRRQHPGIRLLIVGSVKFASDAARYDNASYLRSLERMVVELDLEDSVAFLGEHRDVPEVLSAIDILLAPSWEEPFGRAVLEAMAMEKPVVATCIGGPAEVIEDGVSGVLADPHKTAAWVAAIERLISDESLRADIGKRARRRAIAFSPEAHVARILAVYRQVLVEA